MENKAGKHEEKAEFGPIFSRLYAFFSSHSRSQNKQYSRIAEDVSSMSPSTILEIGSGPGIEAAMIAQRLPDARITCIDPSPTMVKIANDRFRKLSLRDRAVSKLGNSSETGIEGTFDVIFCSQSFHHWENGMQDVQKLIGKHMTKGTFVIYENLVSDTHKGNRAIHGHGITKEFAETEEIPGTRKSLEIANDLVILKFSNS